MHSQNSPIELHQQTTANGHCQWATKQMEAS